MPRGPQKARDVHQPHQPVNNDRCPRCGSANVMLIGDQGHRGDVGHRLVGVCNTCGTRWLIN